ncbi:MAG: hypothetical protein ACLQME_05210 [Alphaproteobacteria bacterium]
MRRTNLGALALAAGTLSLLGGCQVLGPTSIDQGRDRYNSIIHSTAMEQTLSNIIRVANHEPTLFMDVTEVDAVASFVGSVNGAATNIGAEAGRLSTTIIQGRLGNAGVNLQYSETPTIRYQPLLGQPLVAQLVTPISVDALALLYDSYWKVSPLLDLAAAYITPEYDELYAALNIITWLSEHEALELVAGKSDLTKAQEATSKATGANDALLIYLLPFHPHEPGYDLSSDTRVLRLWIRLLWLYSGTQTKFAPQEKDRAWCEQNKLSTDDANKLRDWDLNLESGKKLDLNEARKCLPNSIELRTVPVPPEKVFSLGLISGAPLMRTYSALGILKTATEQPYPKIEFVSADTYRKIRLHPWNQDLDSSSFYTLLPEDEAPGDNPASKSAKGKEEYEQVADWIKASPDNVYIHERKPLAGRDDYIKWNRRLGSLRRYILIVMDDHLPMNPVYVAYADRGKWYYIDGDDTISQKNFDLISLFLTMMSIPSAVPPLSPVINVGG